MLNTERAALDAATSSLASCQRPDRTTGDVLAGLAAAVGHVMRAYGEASNLRDLHKRELWKAERALADRGGRVRGMDVHELLTAKRMGLIAQNAADEELARRRTSFARLATAPLGAGAVVGGHLPCGHGDCMRVVAAAVGFCPEHTPEDRRVWTDAHYSVIDLDELLAEAEKQVRETRRAKETAEAELAQIRARVESFDRSRAEAKTVTDAPAQ